MPGEGDFLPPINTLPPRPSTMPPIGPSGMQVNAEQDGPTGNVTPVEPARRGGRRRRTQAEMLQGAPGAVATAPVPGVPLQPPAPPAPPPIFEAPPPPPLSIPSGVAVPPPMMGPVVTDGPIGLHVQLTDGANMEQVDEELPDAPSFTAVQMAGPRFYVGLGTTVNIGNFENIKYDTGVSGVPVDSTEEQLVQMMEAANARATLVMDMLGMRLMRRVQEVREARGLDD